MCNVHHSDDVRCLVSSTGGVGGGGPGEESRLSQYRSSPPPLFSQFLSFMIYDDY
jgi:hypothetical protein